MLRAKIKLSSYDVHQIVVDVAVNQKDSCNGGIIRDGVVALKSKQLAVDCSSRW
jgi:hypothetical protein